MRASEKMCGETDGEWCQKDLYLNLIDGPSIFPPGKGDQIAPLTSP